MKEKQTVLILANGEYGDLNWYRSNQQPEPFVICADGGLYYAREIGILPDLIVGDMDSAREEDRTYFLDRGVRVITVPAEKDFTDTQLALQVAEEIGCKDVTIWGGTGGRLDHTLTNLLGGVTFVKRGMHLQFQDPMVGIYYVQDSLCLYGYPGDTVSVLALGEDATGVDLIGFRYPLERAVLKTFEPIGVSNEMVGNEAVVKVTHGILAVFHSHINF